MGPFPRVSSSIGLAKAIGRVPEYLLNIFVNGPFPRAFSSLGLAKAMGSSRIDRQKISLEEGEFGLGTLKTGVVGQKEATE
jgi:hypothetical protein